MRETVTRALSGIVYIILLASAIFYSQITFQVLFGLFMIVAIVEFSNLVSIKFTLPLLVGVAAFFIFAYLKTSVLTQQMLLLATLFVSARCLYFLFSNKRESLDNSAKFVYLIGYIILPFILIVLIPIQEMRYEPKVIISIFILIWTNDTFAYIVGKSIGKRKLFEKISPKKTVEGFIGGLILALIVGIIIAQYYVLQPVAYWIVISLIVSVFGTLGDLIQSKFKRMAGVKDSGNIMPGHGGILDRLDSVIFAAPFVFLFYQISSYVS